MDDSYRDEPPGEVVIPRRIGGGIDDGEAASVEVSTLLTGDSEQYRPRPEVTNVRLDEDIFQNEPAQEDDTSQFETTRDETDFESTREGDDHVYDSGAAVSVEVGILLSGDSHDFNNSSTAQGVTSQVLTLGRWDSEAEVTTEHDPMHEYTSAEADQAALNSEAAADNSAIVPDNSEEDTVTQSGSVQFRNEYVTDHQSFEEASVKASSVQFSLPEDDEEDSHLVRAAEEGVSETVPRAEQRRDSMEVSGYSSVGCSSLESSGYSSLESSAYSDDGDDNNDEDSIDFLMDPADDMTKGRRIALYLMKRYKWYNPRLGKAAAAQLDASTHTEVIMNKYKKKVETTEKEIPSLEKAWAFFEHITLPRYVLKQEDDEPQEQRSHLAQTISWLDYLIPCRLNFWKRRSAKKKAKDRVLGMSQMGEKKIPTRLYDPKLTPVSQMGNFGLGVGLYFSTLRALMFLTFICGLTSIPSISFYNSPEYSSDQQAEVSYLMKGSAICTDEMWVPCPNCGESVVTALNTISAVGRDDLDLQRVAYTAVNVTKSVEQNADNTTTLSATVSQTVFLFFALRNLCDGAKIENGAVSFATMIFFIFGMIVLNVYLHHTEIRLVEEVQRTSNYAIMISNPPGDARDPEEWRRFFKINFDAHVTTCTVAVDNDLLVRTLVDRRECMKRLKAQLEPGTKLDTLTLARVTAENERGRGGFTRLLSQLGLYQGVPELYGRVASLNVKCQGLAQLDHDAKKVYVVFEKESDQRRVMKELASVGHLQAKRNDTSAMSDKKCLFRGEHVLRVAEADQPNTIRWQDMNAPYRLRVKQQLWTFLLTGGSIAGIAAIITVLDNYEPLYATAGIATANMCYPEIAKYLVYQFESHRTADDKQVSLYFKISASRIVFTAVLFTIITPVTRTLANDEGLIYKVYSQFLAEIISANAIQLMDPTENGRRHVLAPRAASQDGMNLAMKGYPLELAERYTNITKLLFLCLWYYSVYPATFFLCSLSLYVNIYVDRFCIMRIWKRTPQLGTDLSRVGRRFVFTAMIVVMTFVSGFFFAGFPFDSLCVDSTIDDAYVGTWEVQTIQSTLNENQAWWLGYWRADEDVGTITVVVEAGAPTYRVCPQSFLRGLWGEAADETHFSDEQQILVTIYGYASMLVMSGAFVWFLWTCFSYIRGFFVSSYSEPKRRDRGINFSDVDHISTYIPQVRSTYFSYPLLVCDVEGIRDETLYDWNDPDKTYSDYDLTKDARKLIHGLDLGEKVVFSQIKHWPPDKAEDIDELDESFLEHDVLGETMATVLAPSRFAIGVTAKATKVAAKTSARATKVAAKTSARATKVAAKTSAVAAKTAAKTSAVAAKTAAKTSAVAAKSAAKTSAVAAKTSALAAKSATVAVAKTTSSAAHKSASAMAKSTNAVANATTSAALNSASVMAKSTSAVAKSTSSAAQKSAHAMAKSTTAVGKATTSAAAKSASAVARSTSAAAKSSSAIARSTAKSTRNVAAKSTRAAVRSTNRVAGQSMKAAKSVAKMSTRVQPGLRRMSQSGASYMSRSVRFSSSSFLESDSEDEEEVEAIESVDFLPGEM